MQLLLRIYAKMGNFKFLSLFSVSLSLEINWFLNQLLIAIVFNPSCRRPSGAILQVFHPIYHLPSAAIQHNHSHNLCVFCIAKELERLLQDFCWANMGLFSYWCSNSVFNQYGLSVDILIIRTKSSSILSHTIFPA